MKQLVYSMQFNGNAAPEDDKNPAVLKVKANGISTARGSLKGTGALAGKIGQVEEDATFVSTVRMKDDGTFDEDGTISFGAGNSVRFKTLDRGHAAPSPEPGVTAGAVIWQIEGGEGQFAGASGLITSNFYFNMEGEVTDNQFGVIFAP
jgi:hypothetical protein